MENHGPLGTLWVGLGLAGFYAGLIWINLLLGHILTPMILEALAWLFGKFRPAPRAESR